MSPHEIFSALLPMDTREAVRVIDLIVRDSSVTLDDIESFLVRLDVSTMDLRLIRHDDVTQNMERLLLLMWEKRGETEPLSHAIRVLNVILRENISREFILGLHNAFDDESYLAQMVYDLTARERAMYALYIIAKAPEIARNSSEEMSDKASDYLALVADILGLSSHEGMDVQDCNLDETAQTLWNVLKDAIIGVAHEGNTPISSCLADYGRIISLIFKVETPT